MYSPADLQQEIEKVIEHMEAQNAARLHPDWITQAVMNRHPDVDGEDADFYQCCSRAEVRNQVRRRLNRYKATAEIEADPQTTLEGFERLQKRYLVAEKGEQVAVRIQLMTEQQLLEKAAELRSMGAGCYQHADEIDRYLSSRNVA